MSRKTLQKKLTRFFFDWAVNYIIAHLLFGAKLRPISTMIKKGSSHITSMSIWMAGRRHTFCQSCVFKIMQAKINSKSPETGEESRQR